MHVSQQQQLWQFISWYLDVAVNMHTHKNPINITKSFGSESQLLTKKGINI